MAGYSRRSLVDKLGVRPGMRVVVLHAPPGYRATLGQLPADARLATRVADAEAFVHVFARERAVLGEELPAIEGALEPDGALWVSWPKKASGVASDLSEDVVRRLALAHGLVDVKVAAIDATWSGLKLVRRLGDRPQAYRSRPA